MNLALLAQSIPDFGGSHSKATVDAAELAKQVGPVWFFAILCFVAFVLVILGLGWMAWKFGGKFFDRLDKFLEDIGTATTSNAETLKAQVALCQSMRTLHMTLGGPCNVQDLRDVAYNFASATEKIGVEIGADVKGDCDKIRERLRTIYTPQI